MWATTGDAIARITPSGVITHFALPEGRSGGSITAGSDGNLWFTEDSAVGRITPSGTITEFPYPRTGSNVTCVPYMYIYSSQDIAGAPSEDVWFIDRASMGATGMRIGRITPSGEISWYPGGCIQAIAAGPDGSIWYSGLVRIDPATGNTTTFPAAALGITAGPDGNMWFTEGAGNKIGRITPAGTITEFSLPTPFNNPVGITSGPDGNLWFTEQQWFMWDPLSTTALIGRITTNGDFAGTGGPNVPFITAGSDGNLWLPGSSGIVVFPPTLTPVNVSGPWVSGVAMVGETLRATHGTWMNSPSAFSYQWRRCNSGYECSPVPGATSDSYALSAADVGSHMQVGVSAATSDGAVSYQPAYSDFTQFVQTPQPPGSISAPTIVGVATQGRTLTEVHGTWTGNPTAFAYQWQRCLPGTAACTSIPGATTQSYTLTAADVGSAIRVQEWASNAVGTGGPASSIQTMVVQAITPPTSLSAPTIAGMAIEGRTLTEAHGAWTGNPTALVHQWQRCVPFATACTAIPGANAQTYSLSAADVGSAMRVQEWASNAAGMGGPASSTQTAVVKPWTLKRPQITIAPLISGTARAGLTLTAAAGTWLGTGPLSFAYQWQRCTPGCLDISGAKGAIYKLTDKDVGANVRVLVTASNLAGSAQAPSAQMGPVVPSFIAIKTQLATVMTPSGKAARIGALRKTGGYRASFRAMSGGRLTVSWYYMPRGASLNKPSHRPRPILTATGTVRFSHAGPVTLMIKLTTAGRRRLSAAKTIRLAAQGSYIPVGATATTATRNITLHR